MNISKSGSSQMSPLFCCRLTVGVIRRIYTRRRGTPALRLSGRDGTFGYAGIDSGAIDKVTDARVEIIVRAQRDKNRPHAEGGQRRAKPPMPEPTGKRRIQFA